MCFATYAQAKEYEYFAYSDNVLISSHVNFITVNGDNSVTFTNTNGDKFIVRKDIDKLEFRSHDNIKIKVIGNDFYYMQPTDKIWRKASIQKKHFNE